MLQNIASPGDLKKLNMEEKRALADEIRESLLKTVSETGGHLASNLGSVELTIALHSVFNAPEDKIVFDVGHQAYPHKMLTGRNDRMGTIRKMGGLSGFPRIEESVYDTVNAGHASDSISIALGMARAAQLKNEKKHVICVVGDGALTGGMCYEALNDAGHTKTPMIIVLNDNAMSISTNVGALSKHLTKMRQSNAYRSFKQKLRFRLEKMPRFGKKLTNVLSRVRDAAKSLLVDDLFFDALGIEYLGPIDGHDIAEMERVFERAKTFNEPVVIHVVTVKGRGYTSAEDSPDRFHGVQPFDVSSGLARAAGSAGAGQIAAQELVKLAENDESIVAVSAAMLQGTGLEAFYEAYPARTFDVGIAEEHAVTMAAGLALEGLRPYVAIYSTFLQRAYDQVMMDVCLNNAPVTLLIDRAGLNGADGETHQGIFDIAYLRALPNLIVASPANGAEVRQMVRLAAKTKTPFAIRYPKALRDASEECRFGVGKWDHVMRGSDITIVATGRMVEISEKAVQMLKDKGVSAALVNARFIQPMDEAVLNEIAVGKAPVVTVEDGCVSGGFGEGVMHALSDRGYKGKIELVGAPNVFIPHASVNEQTKFLHMDAESIFRRCLTALGKEA